MVEEGELVLCIVEKIVGTTVFVRLENGEQATLITSEVAPGRIRNIRDYVWPGKKIVCKILKIDERGEINVSLRRVTSKERTEVLERYEREKNAAALLKSVCKNFEQVVAEIRKKGSINEFLQRQNIEEFLDVGMNKEEAQRLIRILSEKPIKKLEVEKKIKLSSNAADGIIRIKQLLKNVDVGVRYVAAPNYLLIASATNYKEANAALQTAIEKLSKEAKEQGCVFEVD